MRWLRSQDPPCPFDERGHTYTTAVTNGHLNVLQWLRSLDPPCVWDEGVHGPCAHAAGKGDLDLLKWLRSEGCPWDREECLRKAFMHEGVLAWIRENA